MNPAVVDEYYDYTSSGLDSFLSRSIDSVSQSNLDGQGPSSNAIAFDRGAISGVIAELFRTGGTENIGKLLGTMELDGSITVSDTGSITVGNIVLNGETGTVSIKTEDGSTVSLGNIDNGNDGLSISDENGFELFRLTGSTWYWYDKTYKVNVMQIGKLPDGKYGFAVAKQGFNVEDIFA